MRLKQLHADGDFTGLLELALLLNYEACYKNSGMLWAMSESLEANRPKVGDGGEKEYAEMVDITIHKLIQLKMQKALDESKAALIWPEEIDQSK
jgi:hypothetical protein